MELPPEGRLPMEPLLEGRLPIEPLLEGRLLTPDEGREPDEAGLETLPEGRVVAPPIRPEPVLEGRVVAEPTRPDPILPARPVANPPRTLEEPLRLVPVGVETLFPRPEEPALWSVRPFGLRLEAKPTRLLAFLSCVPKCLCVPLPWPGL